VGSNLILALKAKVYDDVYRTKMDLRAFMLDRQTSDHRNIEQARWHN